MFDQRHAFAIDWISMSIRSCLPLDHKAIVPILCLKFPSKYQIVWKIFIRHYFVNNIKSPGLRFHCVDYHRLRNNNIIPVAWEFLWHLIKMLSQMPLFIYAFLFTLNAVKLCWGETFHLRDLKLYDHSMFQNRISIPIWISLNQWNGCHLKFVWYSPFPKITPSPMLYCHPGYGNGFNEPN